MWRVIWRGLTSHKLRLALTALAVVLGVAFVAGTFVLTDTINSAFTQLFDQASKGVDVAVRTKATISGNGGQQRAPMPASVVEQVRAVPGVQDADGGVGGYAQFIGKNGKPVTTGGAPTLGVSLSKVAHLQSAVHVREGTLP